MAWRDSVVIVALFVVLVIIGGLFAKQAADVKRRDRELLMSIIKSQAEVIAKLNAECPPARQEP